MDGSPGDVDALPGAAGFPNAGPDPGDGVKDMTNPTTGPRRLSDCADRREGNNFDFLRLFLAILVILSHSWLMLELARLATSGAPKAPTEPLMLITHGQMDLGSLAVNGFFIISGFLITQSWLRSSSWLDYLTRRVLRIYPGLLAAGLVSGLIVAPILKADAGAYLREIRWPAFLLSLIELRPMTGSANGSLYTIRYEFGCYLGVLFLGLGRMLRRRGWVLGALVVMLGCLAAKEMLYGRQIVDPRTPGPIFYALSLSRLASNFLAGMVFYLYRDRITLSMRACWAAAVVLVLLGIQPWFPLFPIGFPVLGAYVVFTIAYLPIPWMHDWARHRDLSYGMYLYAYPLQMLLTLWLGPWLEPWTAMTPLSLFVASMPPTILCALASWRWVESPAIRARRPVAAWLDRWLGATAARDSIGPAAPGPRTDCPEAAAGPHPSASGRPTAAGPRTVSLDSAAPL